MNEKHLIYFYSSPTPKMQYWGDDQIIDEELDGELTFNFSFDRKCIGYKTEEKYFKCPYHSESKKQCYSCTFRDISKVYTRLDFTGYEHIKEEISRENFSIYLALFGESIIKCGVTRTERVSTRTIEQGADYFVELMRFDNAELAYDTESNLQNTFNFKNAVRVERKLKIALAANYNSAKLEEAVASVSQNNDFSSLIHSKQVQKIDYNTPKDFTVANAIDGQILCSKSSLLFFKKDGENFCINMRKKEGCEF